MIYRLLFFRVLFSPAIRLFTGSCFSGYYSHQWSEISSSSQLVDCDPITSGSGPAAAAAAGPKPSGTLAENTKSAVIVKTGEFVCKQVINYQGVD